MGPMQPITHVGVFGHLMHVQIGEAFHRLLRRHLRTLLVLDAILKLIDAESWHFRVELDANDAELPFRDFEPPRGR